MRNDWVEVELGTICDFVGGGTPSKKEPDYWGGDIPWASIKDVKGSCLLSTEDFITLEGLKNSAANVAEIDEIILATRITPGRPILSKIRTAINQDLKIVKPKIAIDVDFLYYAFRNLEKSIRKQSSGTTVLGVNLNNLKAIKTQIPSLPEQRAIVAKIDEIFSELDNGIANLKAAQAKLDIYRQAVLKQAFEGELTREWRSNKNLDDINHTLSIIKSSSKKPLQELSLEHISLNIPSKWKWIASGNFFTLVTSGSRGWAQYYNDTEGSIFLRITNLDFDTLELDLSLKKLQYVKLPDTVEGKRTKIQENDFLFSITGYLGMFAIAPNLEDAYVNQHIALARPVECINFKWLGYWIISKVGGHLYLNRKSKGATKAGLVLSDIQNFPVPLCSLEEQNQIVQEIEARLSVCDKLAETIQTSLQQAEALRQSILKKAFEGRLLTETELQTCKAQADWMPAEQLLAQIKSSKAK